MRTEALGDLERILDWYAARSPAAAHRFAAAVEASLDLIEARPLRFPMLNERHRYARVGRFPYVVVFRTFADRSMVIAIQHTSQSDAELSWRDP